MGSEVVIGSYGHIVVPEALLRELGLESGDVLTARTDGGRIVLEPRSALLARIRQRLATVPPEVSLVDELIDERRREVRRATSG